MKTRSEIRAQLPADDEEAITWMVNRLIHLVAEQKRVIKHKYGWRRVDPESLEVAMERGIDNAVATRFPIRHKPRADRMSKSECEAGFAALAGARKRSDTLALLVRTVRDLRDANGRQIDNLEAWRDLHPESHGFALHSKLVRDVCRLAGLSYRQGSEIPATTGIGQANMRYPRSRIALEAFLVEFVKELTTEDGKPVSSLNEWRNAHEGSYAKAVANRLQGSICKALGLRYTWANEEDPQT